MSGSEGVSSLRRSYRRARSLDFDEQLRECIDQLQNPQLIARELEEAHSACAPTTGGCYAVRVTRASDQDESERARWFYTSRDIFVVRDSSSFTCVAERVETVPTDRAAPDGFEGLDYLALTCTPRPRPILGVVQSGLDATAYPMLLRLLAAVCELGHVPQLDRLDRLCFKGVLGVAPCFDLHLVLWDDWAGDDVRPERTPISQLTRDLAEKAKIALAEAHRFPPIIGDVVCLHMNPARFDGRVRFDWRV
jgi:hypothetical protein